jgi:hypothetical protein
MPKKKRKSENIMIRATPDLKGKVLVRSAELGVDMSKYISELIKDDLKSKGLKPERFQPKPKRILKLRRTKQ